MNRSKKQNFSLSDVPVVLIAELIECNSGNCLLCSKSCSKAATTQPFSLTFSVAVAPHSRQLLPHQSDTVVTAESHAMAE